jgi:hypothetical protein
MDWVPAPSLLGSQTGNSLARPQFTIKEYTEPGKCISQFPRLEEMSWMPRAPVKLELRLRVSFKKQHSAGAKSAANLWEK